MKQFLVAMLIVSLMYLCWSITNGLFLFYRLPKCINILFGFISYLIWGWLAVLIGINKLK